MTEQELKEYTWEIGERLEHLKTVLPESDINQEVDNVINEMIDTLKLTPQEMCPVVSTLMLDYAIPIIPCELKNFDRFHMLCGSYIMSLPKDIRGLLETPIRLGRRQ